MKRYNKQLYLQILQLFDVDTESNATLLFNNLKESIETSAEEASSHVNSNAEYGNYKKYTVSFDDTYIVLTKIDDSLLYTYNHKDSKNHIKEIIKGLGY